MIPEVFDIDKGAGTAFFTARTCGMCCSRNRVLRKYGVSRKGVVCAGAEKRGGMFCFFENLWRDHSLCSMNECYGLKRSDRCCMQSPVKFLQSILPQKHVLQQFSLYFFGTQNFKATDKLAKNSSREKILFSEIYRCLWSQKSSVSKFTGAAKATFLSSLCRVGFKKPPKPHFSHF